jgi:hypothetical protein
MSPTVVLDRRHRMPVPSRAAGMTVVRSIEFQRAAKYNRGMSRLMARALAMAAR